MASPGTALRRSGSRSVRRPLRIMATRPVTPDGRVPPPRRVVLHLAIVCHGYARGTSHAIMVPLFRLGHRAAQLPNGRKHQFSTGSSNKTRQMMNARFSIQSSAPEGQNVNSPGSTPGLHTAKGLRPRRGRSDRALNNYVPLRTFVSRVAPGPVHIESLRDSQSRKRT